MHEWPTARNEEHAAAEQLEGEWNWKEHPNDPHYLIADNAAVPSWYQEGGYEEAERRRPAVRMVSGPAGEKYVALWDEENGRSSVSLGNEHIFDSLSEAQQDIRREWEKFMQSKSLADYDNIRRTQDDLY